jgi:hypothetical protein
MVRECCKAAGPRVILVHAVDHHLPKLRRVCIPQSKRARHGRLQRVMIDVVKQGRVTFMSMAELAPADLKRRGHVGRGRSTLVSKTHQRTNQEGDTTSTDVASKREGVDGLIHREKRWWIT